MAINPKALDKANSRLRVARKALSELAESKSREQFSDTWYTFLVATKNVYTALEQGSKTTPQDRQWFGAKKQQRKDDELLQYLFQARDDDEHGVEQVTEFVPGSLGIGVAEEGYSSAMRFDGMIGSGGKLKVTPLDGKPVLIEFTAPHMKLATVTGRGNIKYPPPSTHLGQTLQARSPEAVAELGLAYLTGLVEEAENRE